MDSVYELIPHTCATCGKIFYPAPYHRYANGRKIYCSWTCMAKRDKAEFHSCTECAHLIECGPLKMALNSHKDPCEDFKEKGKKDEES